MGKHEDFYIAIFIYICLAYCSASLWEIESQDCIVHFLSLEYHSNKLE